MRPETEIAAGANGGDQDHWGSAGVAIVQGRADVGNALATLDDYQRAGGYNVLSPVIVAVQGGGISPYLAEAVTVVSIAATKESGEVYNDFRYANERDGKFALTSLALSKISAAAGVKWIPEHCKILVDERRPDGHRQIVYQAAAGIRTPTGEWHVEIASKEIDTADVEEQLRDADRRTYKRTAGSQNANKWVKDLGPKPTPEAIEEAITDRVRQQLLQLREHLLSHCETKAKSRAIRRILSLKQVYTKVELGRPFAVPRLVYRPDFTNPLELERVQVEGREAASSVFGDAPESHRDVAVAELPSEASEAGAPSQEQRPSGNAREEAVAATATEASTGVVSDDVKGGEAETVSSERPKQDPIVEGGPNDGKAWSEVVHSDPGYLRAIATESRARAKRELAQLWLDWAYPPLAG